MKLSVNILTWNTINCLKRTLEVLKGDLKDIEHEIIIVDQGSIDGCEKLATIKNEVNTGISIGKNQGIKASQGEYIMLIDGDVVPVPNSINKLLEYMEKDSNCEALGFYPNQFTSDKQKAEQFCFDITKPVLHDSACLFYGMYRKDVFEKVLLDESGEFGKCGYGWEDRDFFIQMREAGIDQYVCGINSLIGKYFHAINSSFKMPGNMTREEYVMTSKKRHNQFKDKWGEKCLIK